MYKSAKLVCLTNENISATSYFCCKARVYKSGASLVHHMVW